MCPRRRWLFWSRVRFGSTGSALNGMRWLKLLIIPLPLTDLPSIRRLNNSCIAIYVTAFSLLCKLGNLWIWRILCIMLLSGNLSWFSSWVRNRFRISFSRSFSSMLNSRRRSDVILIGKYKGLAILRHWLPSFTTILIIQGKNISLW